MAIKKRAIVIGSGISGLIQAFELLNEVSTLSVISAGPDPRLNIDPVNHQLYSSTHGGGFGRFITGFEAEPHLDIVPGGSSIYPNMEAAFQKSIVNGGWLAKDKEYFNLRAQDWLNQRQSASLQGQQIESATSSFISDNIYGIRWFNSLAEKSPSLVKNTDFKNKGIIRLFDKESALNSALALNTKYNQLINYLQPKQISLKFGSFKEACMRGTIVGALETQGLTLEPHNFCRNIIDYLETKGVKFYWSTEINKIKLDDGSVEGISDLSGQHFESDFFFFHTGAYASALYSNISPIKNKIHGVAGRWVLLENPGDIDCGIKIHADLSIRDKSPSKEFVFDIAVTPFTSAEGKSMLAVGGGYLYLGPAPFDLLSFKDSLSFLDSFSLHTLDKFLAGSDILKTAKICDWTCVRSFTPEDSSVEVILPTKSGGKLAIAGGSNTGSAAIAPALAKRLIKLTLSAS